MRTFKDKHGKEYKLDFKLDTFRQIRDALDIDILKMDILTLAAFIDDYVGIGPVLFVCVDSQIEREESGVKVDAETGEETAKTSKELDEDAGERFAKSMFDGNLDLLEEASDAFAFAYADFSPRRKREALTKFLMDGKRLQEEAFKTLMEKPTTGD